MYRRSSVLEGIPHVKPIQSCITRNLGLHVVGLWVDLYTLSQVWWVEPCVSASRVFIILLPHSSWAALGPSWIGLGHQSAISGFFPRVVGNWIRGAEFAVLSWRGLPSNSVNFLLTGQTPDFSAEMLRWCPLHRYSLVLSILSDELEGLRRALNVSWVGYNWRGYGKHSVLESHCIRTFNPERSVCAPGYLRPFRVDRARKFIKRHTVPYDRQ